MTEIATRLDPITYEVVKHRLWQINDEQAITIRTISASPIVVEGNDFNVGIFTADGRLAVSGFGSLVHVTTMGSTIRNIIAKAGEVNEGDAFLVNDPYMGALHQNDVILASPFFVDGERVAWVANVLHHADVGGIDEGSFCINARNLYQDPPRYFLKLVDRGRLSGEVEHTFATNSRLPNTVGLDLKAQIGAINVAQRRLGELVTERGLATVLETIEQSLRLAELQIRERLRELPDGHWEAEVFMDGDRVGSDRIVRVAVQLTKRGEELAFDYAGTDPQVDAAVNCTYDACYSGTAVPVYTFLCSSDIDWNEGLKPCLKVSAPEGSVVNARFPAPCSISTVGFRWLVTAAANKVVAEMFAASADHIERACPSWNVSSNCNNLFGTDAKGRRVGALLSDHRGGGSGGRSFGDGFSHAGQVTSLYSSLANVESVEWKLPVMYLYRKQLIDSGGPGMYRGGLASESAMMPFQTQLVLKSTNTAGTDQSNAFGICGGYPGAGSQVTLVKDSDVWNRLASGQPVSEPEQLGGAVSHLPSKSEATLGPTDVLVFHAPGGGGFGDPLLRNPAAVATDVAHGRVSVESARERYGVALTPEQQVDATATAKLRATLRARRLSRDPNGFGTPATVASRMLELAGGTLRCRGCGPVVGPDVTAANASVLRHSAPLSAAGPWLAVRWHGHSPNFELEETLCPDCGTLFDVREKRKV